MTASKSPERVLQSAMTDHETSNHCHQGNNHHGDGDRDGDEVSPVKGDNRVTVRGIRGGMLGGLTWYV